MPGEAYSVYIQEPRFGSFLSTTSGQTVNYTSLGLD